MIQFLSMIVETAHVDKAHNTEENKDERDKPKTSFLVYTS